MSMERFSLEGKIEGALRPRLARRDSDPLRSTRGRRPADEPPALMKTSRTSRAKADALTAQTLVAALRDLGARIEPAASSGSRAMELSFGPASPSWTLAPPPTRGDRWTLSLASDDVVDLARLVAESR